MLEKCIKDVLEFDKKFGIEEENNPTYPNLFYMGLCLAGESGELINNIKKIWRDGDSKELREQLSEELVDVVIYICKLIIIGEIDFKAAWERKQKILIKRWNKKLHTKRRVKI